MNTQDLENNIILRTKFLCGTNACVVPNEMRIYARQAVKELLPSDLAQSIYCVFDITLEDYIDYILRKVLAVKREQPKISLIFMIRL